MLGIYFFENKKCVDLSLGPLLQINNLRIDYEDKMHCFLHKIKSLKPDIVFLKYDNHFYDKIVDDLFCKDSMFYTTCVVVFKKPNSDAVFNSLNIVVVEEDKTQEQLSKIIERLKEVVLKNQTYKMSYSKTDNLNKLLLRIGFKDGHKGTIYLKECIKYYLCDRLRYSTNITEIYENISALHNTKFFNIERCMRSAINSVWKNINVVKVSQETGIDPVFFETKPSSKQLVITLGEHLVESLDDFNDENCDLLGIKNFK